MLPENCIKEQKIITGNSVWSCWQYLLSRPHRSQHTFNVHKHSGTEDVSGTLPVLPQLFKINLFLNIQICNIKWLLL